MTSDTRRRILGIAALAVAGLASIATSPGPPTVELTVSGYASVVGELPASIDVFTSVDAAVAVNVSIVRVQVESTRSGESVPVTLEARLAEVSGPVPLDGWNDSRGRPGAGVWTALSGYWVSDSVECAARANCEFRHRLEIRALEGPSLPITVPWLVTVSVSSISNYNDVRVVGSSPTAAQPPAAFALIAAVAGALIAALARLALGRFRSSRATAQRLVEVGSACAIGIVGLGVLVGRLTTPALAALAMMMCAAAAVLLFVALRRPPGDTPRATPAVLTLLLLPASLSITQTAIALDQGWSVAVHLALGALAGVGVIAVLSPASFWRNLVVAPRHRYLVAAVALLLLVLFGFGLYVATTTFRPDLVPSAMALMAIWLLLAFREWTEGSPLALRMAGVLLLLVTLGGACAFQSLSNGFPIGRSVPLPTWFIGGVVTLAIATLAGVIAYLAGPRDEEIGAVASQRRPRIVP